MRLRPRIRPFVAGLFATAFAGALLGGAGLMASAGPAAAATTTVHIGTAFVFSPSAVTIHVGDTVVWQHDSSAILHSVTADNGSFDSSPSCPPTCLGASATFSHTFTSAGTIRYYCKIHGGPGGVGMSGTITVLAATPSTTTPGTTTPGPATTIPLSTGGTPASPTPGATAAPAAPSASLPRTGSNTVPFLLAGAAALVLGCAALTGRRRMRPTR